MSVIFMLLLFEALKNHCSVSLLSKQTETTNNISILLIYLNHFHYCHNYYYWFSHCITHSAFPHLQLTHTLTRMECTHEYTSTHTHTHTDTQAIVNTHTHTHTHPPPPPPHTHKHIHKAYKHTLIHTYTHILCINTHIQTHTHTHTHTHTRTHSHINANSIFSCSHALLFSEGQQSWSSTEPQQPVEQDLREIV